jgi:restriction system protein
VKTVKSTVQSKAIWAIRAGKNGEADELFLTHGRIVLSDPGLGDLSKLTSERSVFYSAYRALHPDATNTAVGGIGGKFFRFVHEIEIGDLVLYPSLKDRQVYIGEITGDYIFDKSLCLKFPHQRSARWRYVVPKSEFSKKAQQELGAARTFFKFKRHANEIEEMITQKRVKRFASSKKAE